MSQAPAKPFEDCYWVAPGALLAGEYPGHYDPAKARAKVAALLDVGIDWFLDLTSEDDPLEPYDDVVHAEAERRGAAVTYVRRAVPDMRCPPVDFMRQILDDIDRATDAGHAVYVHCWGGVGRTGTVVGCHLVRRGMPPRAALDEVARRFATMSPGKIAAHPRSPQTAVQRRFVLDWHRHERRRTRDAVRDASAGEHADE